MVFLLRLLRFLSIFVWLGGIVFFVFVLAPVAFRNLPSAHEAGLVVRAAIGALHWMGLICGAVFVVATLLFGRRRKLGAEAGLAGLMLAFTAISQFYVLPAMEVDRAGGAIETLDAGDTRRIDFERLHILSERLEGAVLLLGLSVIVVMATGE